MLNYTKVANDAQVAPSTLREYFQILEDTFLGKALPAFTKTTKRKAISQAKFYLFDNGVVHTLQGRRALVPRTPEFGIAFESYIDHELRAYIAYTQRMNLSYWRSTSGFEVDFILGDEIAIEVKAKDAITEHDVRGLRALSEEGLCKRHIAVSFDRAPRRIGIFEVLPYGAFLDALWDGAFD